VPLVEGEGGSKVKLDSFSSVIREGGSLELLYTLGRLEGGVYKVMISISL
jgi:hypothetical protein